MVNTNEEIKYCPLFTIAASKLGIESPQKCMEKKCAWYSSSSYTDPKTGDYFWECSITRISSSVEGINLNG